MTTPHPSPTDRRSGFALLITITLLAFLVLLMVSLASLTRVETQVASNTHQHVRARQHALTALNIALGQLQLTLGPDRRISVPAAQQGNGVPDFASADPDNNAHWTGVYRQDPALATHAPQLISWLVSGNHTLTVHATGANTPPVTPSASVTSFSGPLDQHATATTPGLKIGTRDAILLVGPASVRAEPSASAPISVASRFVVAPLENIQVAEGDLPGFNPASSAPATIGRFAYWIGDEGIKARANLRDPGAQPAAGADAIEYRLKAAQRSGIELMNTSSGTALSEVYQASGAGLDRVLDLNQLPLSHPSGQLALADAVKTRFHDLTATAASLHVDVARGGLKKDLTTWLAHPSNLPSTAPLDSEYIAPPHATDTTGYGLPKWGLLRTHANFPHGTRAPQPQTDAQEGVYPVITYFRIGFSASSDEDSPANPTPPLRIHAYPVVVLWNPHDTPIGISQYEVAYGLRFNTATGVFVNTTKNPANPDAETLPSWQTAPSGTNVRKGRLLMNTAEMTNAAPPAVNGAQATRRYFRFLVDLTEPLGPGESRVFTLDDTERYSAGTPGKLPNRMRAHTDYRKDNSAYFENAAVTLNADEIWVNTATRSVRRQFYVLTNGGEMELGLFPVLAAGANPTVAEMIASNPYQLVQHIGITEYARRIRPVQTVEMDDTYICAYQWAQLQMSVGNSYFRTPRWLAQSNPRAARHLAVSYPAPNQANSIATQVYIGSSYLGQPGSGVFDENRASAGRNINAPPVISTAIAGVPPGPANKPWKRFFSLAQFQHANVSLLAQNPAYAIGNSLASYHIYKENGTVGLTDTSLTGVPLNPASTVTNPSNQLQRLYDLSYVLNTRLWDRYFFSTLPSSGADSLTNADIINPAYHLPNARHVFHLNEHSAPSASELVSPAAFDRAAARLLLNGGFNVNSASEQAWRALLASHNHVDTSGAFTHPYARFPATAAGDPANTPWSSGYRILSDDQIKTLARTLVAEVRQRGPFLSLADFVNRRLRNDASGYKGPLQAAIDATDTDPAPANRINDLYPFNDYAATDPNATHRIVTYASSATGTTTADFQRLMRGGATTTDTPSASRAAFAPGFLTQADLLQVLGPVLAARSDTFRIRAYGETVNPSTNVPEGRAWCEAVVQRLPDYIGGNLPSWDTPAPGSDEDTFGRRFRIVSFRWLGAADI